MASFRATVVADAEAALNEVVEPVAPDIAVEVPDGLGALPFIIARLPASRKREVVLRLVALILATWFYLDALMADELGKTHVAAVLLTNFWLYSTVLSASRMWSRNHRQASSPTV